MHRNPRLVDVWHFMHQLADDLAKFVRNGVAHGVWDIDGAGAGFNRRLNDATQIINRSAARIFTGKLDIVGIAACVLNTSDRLVRGFSESFA